MAECAKEVKEWEGEMGSWVLDGESDVGYTLQVVMDQGGTEKNYQMQSEDVSVLL